MKQNIDLELVRYELKYQDKTQAELAKHLGITTNTMVSIFKSGICTTNHLERMAEFLSAEVGDFVATGEVNETGLQTALNFQIRQLDRSTRKLRLELKEANKTIGRLENLVETQTKYIKLLEEKLEKHD